MGKIKQGILGGFSGKVGTVIGSFWKGTTYMRGLIQSHHDARTQQQLEQRAKFSLISKFVSSIQTVAKIGFKCAENGTTALNECMAYNIKNAVSGTYPNFAVDFANVMVSTGPLPNVEGASATDDSGGHVEITWNDNTGDGDATADDAIMLVVYNSDSDEVRCITAAAKRADESYTFANPSAWSGDTAHVYLAVKHAKSNMTSKSIHVGAVVLS